MKIVAPSIPKPLLARSAVVVVGACSRYRIDPPFLFRSLAVSLGYTARLRTVLTGVLSIVRTFDFSRQLCSPSATPTLLPRLYLATPRSI